MWPRGESAFPGPLFFSPRYLGRFLYSLKIKKATSFPGSLSTASLCRWDKDPHCGWSPNVKGRQWGESRERGCQGGGKQIDRTVSNLPSAINFGKIKVNPQAHLVSECVYLPLQQPIKEAFFYFSWTIGPHHTLVPRAFPNEVACTCTCRKQFFFFHHNEKAVINNTA